MNGYYFSGDFISYAMNAYGVEDLVYQLYYLSAGEFGDGVQKFVTYYDAATGYYSFLFTYGEINYGVYFTIDSDFVMESVIVTGTQGYPDISANDKVYYLKIDQTKGERTATTPSEYDPEILLINSFAVKDAQNKVMNAGDTLDVLAGYSNLIQLSITNILPTTSSAVYDRIDATCADGGVILYVDNETGKISINGQKEGIHEVTVFTDHVTFTFNVKVTLPAPTEIRPLIYTSNGSFNMLESGATVNMFLGGTLNISGGTSNFKTWHNFFLYFKLCI